MSYLDLKSIFIVSFSLCLHLSYLAFTEFVFVSSLRIEQASKTA